MRSGPWRICASGAALLLLAACGGSKSQPDAGYTESIGREGGQVAFAGFVLSIPQGALDGPTDIRIYADDGSVPDVPDRVRVSRVFSVEPDTLVFKLPVTVVVPWQSELLPRSIPASAIDARRTDFSSAVERLAAAQVNEPGKTVSAETTKLGRFWATAPAAPRPASITIKPAVSAMSQGTTAQLRADVRDQNGRLMTGETIVWSSSDTSVATVDARGLVTGVYPGVVRIVAKAGAAQAKATVEVWGKDAYPNEFSWENPLPEGNPLYAVGGDAATLYVGGDNGTLLRQSAQGWSNLYSTLGVRLRCIGAGPLAVAAGGSRDTDGVIIDVVGVIAHESTIPDTPIVGVWVGTDAGMAVGDGPNVAVRESSGMWSALPSPVTEPLLAVDGSSGAPVVVGARGAVYKRQGDAWVALSTDPLPQLQLAAAVSGEEAWAISATALRHFANGRWATLPLTLPDGTAELRFQMITLAGGTPVIGAADLTGKPFVLVVDPASGAATVQSMGADAITGLWGRSASDLFAVTVVGAILHWDGATWKELRQGTTTDIVAIAAFEGPRVFAVTNICGDDACSVKKAQVLDRDATTGQFRALGAPLATSVMGIAGRSASDLWAVGLTGNAYHYDGTAWATTSVTGGTTLYSVAACTAGAWAGGSTRIMRENAGVWTVAYNGTANRYRAIACAGDGAVAVGDYTIVLLDGKGAATPIDTQEYGIPRNSWGAVWANASGQAFIGGDARYILWWDGERLVYYDQPGGVSPKSVKALWATSFGSLWAAGSKADGTGFLLHFNGAEWTQVDAGTTVGLTALSGLASGELWVAGIRGAILHAPIAAP